MKKIFVFLFSITLLFVGCSNPNSSASPDNQNLPDNKDDKPASISKEYWGSWICMETGDEYYIDNECIYKSSSANKKETLIQKGSTGFSIENNNTLKNGNLRYFKKGGNTRNFEIQVTDFTDEYSQPRSASIGKKGITCKRVNQNNPSDTQTVISDENGKILFTDAVADDPQIITIDESSAESSTIITPEFNGQNMGSIPVVEENMYGFKTTYTMYGDETGCCYGNYYKTYTLTLNLTNIGSATCSTSYYVISCEDPKLQFVDTSLSGNFSSILPGKSKTVTLKVKYGYVADEYVDVPLNIAITDSKYSRTWNDSVTLRFYKGKILFLTSARNFDQNFKTFLNATLIFPDGRTVRFTTQAGSRNEIKVPWSKENYTLVFNGATAENEMAYAFGFYNRENLEQWSLSGTWYPEQINAYEKNDTYSTAANVTDSTTAIKAYLYDGDIDYYIINNSNYEPIITYTQFNSLDFQKLRGCTEKYEVSGPSPGKSYYFDIKFKYILDSTLSNVTATLSSTSEYVTIDNPTCEIGTLFPDYYYTLTDSSSNSDNCRYFHNANDTNVFKYTVHSDCPQMEHIPFVITFKDSTGFCWTESLLQTVF